MVDDLIEELEALKIGGAQGKFNCVRNDDFEACKTVVSNHFARLLAWAVDEGALFAHLKNFLTVWFFSRDFAKEGIECVPLAAKLIEEIRHFLTRAQPGVRWQPIETVLTDVGTSFFVLRRNNANALVAVQASWVHGNLFPDYLGSDIAWDDRITDATHWRPLDPLPVVDQPAGSHS